MKRSMAKTKTKSPKAEVRNLAVYKDDLEFFAAVADQNDRSRARMFRFAMARIRDGKPIPYVPATTNGAAK